MILTPRLISPWKHFSRNYAPILTRFQLSGTLLRDYLLRNTLEVVRQLSRRNLGFSRNYSISPRRCKIISGNFTSARIVAELFRERAMTPDDIRTGYLEPFQTIFQRGNFRFPSSETGITFLFLSIARKIIQKKINRKEPNRIREREKKNCSKITIFLNSQENDFRRSVLNDRMAIVNFISSKRIAEFISETTVDFSDSFFK